MHPWKLKFMGVIFEYSVCTSINLHYKDQLVNAV
jgi:hypothetical protein